ncbi:hypothetical protein MSTO_31260 [Mycobacterium stomatepiae]|uniref:Uncharacterized protein n=1 Tax=Mycobacterium stomatepiae TaxID=470076 RepID=A0A7I7Q9T7_9MYCO|nr:hypothetical protein MSTO_31260 [Mycobacterium stomatepiae]
MAHVGDVEHQGLVAEQETAKAVADPIDIDGIDLSPDGHHRGEVAALRPNLGSTAVEAALSRCGHRDCHERPHFGDGAKADAVPTEASYNVARQT